MDSLAIYLELYCMPWDYKRDFEFLANVVKVQHTFYFLIGGTCTVNIQ